MTIPKVIHYCWFGHNHKPPLVERCMASWRQALPGYRIKEWNESNFDTGCFPYVAEAYEARKFAFVSDVARGQALYREGGIYLDTDVEVLKSFDPLLVHRSFWGFEAGNFLATSTFGSIAGHPLLAAYLEHYRDRHFVKEDGSYDLTTNVSLLTSLWEGEGIALDNAMQRTYDGDCIYPQRYFSPYDYRTGGTASYPESYTIHHYTGTWNSSRLAEIKRAVKRVSHAILGERLSSALWLKNHAK
ncbi:glycosyl transferase [Geomonas sp. Red276]